MPLDQARRPPRTPPRPEQFRARHGAQPGGYRPSDLHAFLAAGYEAQALNVVMGMAFSVMANFASHLTRPPLDSFLATHVWTR